MTVLDLLTVQEIARQLRVSNMTIYRLIDAGALQAIKVGNRFRINQAELDRFIDERQT